MKLGEFLLNKNIIIRNEISDDYLKNRLMDTPTHT